LSIFAVLLVACSNDVILRQINISLNLNLKYNVFEHRAVADAFSIASSSFIHSHSSPTIQIPSSILRPTSLAAKSGNTGPIGLKSKAYFHRRHSHPLSILHLSNSESSVISNCNEDEEEDCYDLVVIGAGPVGVKAALLATTTTSKSDSATATPNRRVALIDAPLASGALYQKSNPTRDLSIGGPTGLFSKALRDSSKRINVESLRGMGLREDSIWNEITSSCVDLATWNSEDAVRQLEYAGVDYIQGSASFEPSVDVDDVGDGGDGGDGGGATEILRLNVLQTKPPGTTDDDDKEQILQVRAKKVLIATGSRPFRPSGIPFDGHRIFDSDSINQLSYLPSSIAITGSGIIAIEFAKIFSNLGSDVTLIIRDGSPRNALMKIGLDIDVSASLVADLVRSGIKIERGSQVSSFSVPTTNDNDNDNGYRTPLTITLEPAPGDTRRNSRTSSQELRCDAYLAAVGRMPNTAGLGLDGVGILVDEYGGLKVGADLRTTEAGGNVYGAGDVLGRPFLASTGVAQAVAAIQTMYGDKPQSPCSTTDDTPSPDDNEEVPCLDGVLSLVGENFDPKSLATNPFAFPTGIWSSPEAAYFGLSKQHAIELGIDAAEGVALYSECLRGLVFSPNGLLKLVFDRGGEGRIIGVHICGDDACELIHYGMELVRAGRTVGDVANEVYSAVTYHEMYRIAARAAIDEKGARKRRAAAGTALAARNRAAKKK